MAHIALFFILCIKINEDNQIENHFVNAISTHLVQINFNEEKISMRAPIVDSTKSDSNQTTYFKKSKKISESNSILKSNPSMSKLERKTQAQNIKNSQTPNQSAAKLLTLLHQAIQAKQIYPQLALELKQSGSTQVAFMLFPDGHITDLRINHTSGFNSLDEAALTAVREAAPFQNIGRYIDNPKPFKINIVFELTIE